MLTLLHLSLLPLVAGSGPATATITSGGLFTTDKGETVQAHGAGFLLPGVSPATANGTYYLVGATQKTQPGWLSSGVNLYSSLDLETWTFVAEIFRTKQITTPLPKGEAQYPYRLERPKLLYNAKTKRYVLWFHLDSISFKMGMVGVATCESVGGTYDYVRGWQPDGQRSLDMTVFQDADGSAWLVRSVDNNYAGFSRLTDDYLDTTGIVARTEGKIEGQAVWKDDVDGHYYLLGSHLTGWAANPALLYRSQEMSGSWELLDVDVGGPTTNNSQSCFVLPVRTEQGSMLVYIGDRWNERGPGSVGAASYVWLPLLRDGDRGYRLARIGDGSGDGRWRVADYLHRDVSLFV